MTSYFPWRQPVGVFSDRGPGRAIDFEVSGVRLKVEPTGLTGMNTGRGRYRCYCVDCQHVVHGNTTCPDQALAGHLKHRHGIKAVGYAVPCVDIGSKLFEIDSVDWQWSSAAGWDELREGQQVRCTTKCGRTAVGAFRMGRAS